MLPDYPKIKKRLEELLLLKVKAVEKQYAPMAAQVSKSMIFEGHRAELIHEDGKLDKIRTREISARVSINLTEMEDLPPEKVLEKLNEAGKEMAKQKTQFMVEDLDTELEKIGHTRNMKGQKFQIDHLLDMFEKLWIDFDEAGKPYLPSIFAGDKAAKVIMEEIKRTENNPAYNERIEKIMEKKRQEWNARESNRKLVG